MPEVFCPCGARVTAYKSLSGWTTEMGKSFARYCIELQDELNAKGGAVKLSEFNCKRLDKLVAGKMQRA